MAPAIQMVSACLPPGDAYMEVVKKGEKTAAGGWLKCFHQAFVGGCYIGFGGLLSFVIGGQLHDDRVHDVLVHLGWTRPRC